MRGRVRSKTARPAAEPGSGGHSCGYRRVLESMIASIYSHPADQQYSAAWLLDQIGADPHPSAGGDPLTGCKPVTPP